MKTSEYLLIIAGLVITAQADIDYVDDRQEREIYSPLLVEPYGGNIKLVIGIGIPIYIPGRSLVYGQNMQFQYPMPDNATFFSNLFSPDTSTRRRRSSSSDERAIAYNILQQHLDRNGVDGKECVMRGICEAAETPLKEEGLVGELLHFLLTPDYGDNISVEEEYVDAKEAGLRGEDCTKLFPGCPQGHGILDHVSTIEYEK